MKKLKEAAENPEAAEADLKKLSDEVHKTMVAQGYAEAESCRTECSVSVGPDGKPVVTCRVVCDW